MKKIVVTGGAGFIGSEVVKNLLQKGYTVRVIDNLSKEGSKASRDCEFLQVDLLDRQKTIDAFQGMDICINLAAKIGGIGYFHKYPATILADNNIIYSHTFEAAVKQNLSRMVYISSSMVFESAATFPSKESDIAVIPPPISSYGFSKLIGEQYCKAFFDQYQLPYSICRPFNAYGINEYPGDEIGIAHVIPDLIKKILHNQYPLELLGNGKQIRCFTHIRDLAEGIVTVAESENARNEDFNIADATPVSIEDLAKLLWKLTGQKKPLQIKTIPGFTFDIQKRIPDVSKIKYRLNWEAKIPLEIGLQEVVEWMQSSIHEF